MKKPVSTVKKVALMGSSASAKKVGSSPPDQSRPELQKASLADSKLVVSPAQSHILSSCKKAFMLTVAAIIAAVIFLPKPQLVYYSVQGKEESSVYWPGFDGGAFEGRLLDADYSAGVNEETKTLYLCNRGTNGQEIDHCSKYPIRQTKGLVSALFRLARQERIY